MEWIDEWSILIAQGERDGDPHEALLIEGGGEDLHDLRSVVDSVLANAGPPNPMYRLEHRRSELSWGASGASELISLILALDPQQTVFDLLVGGAISKVVKKIKSRQNGVGPLTDHVADARARHAVGMTFEGREAKHMEVVGRTIQADARGQEVVLEDLDGVRFKVRIEASGLIYMSKTVGEILPAN